MTARPQFYRFHQGDKVLPFAPAEYDARLAGLRAIMADKGVEAAVFTSMHNIAYYSGFLYCSFGRPYGLVVTATESVTISAGIDAGQPSRRSHGAWRPRPTSGKVWAEGLRRTGIGYSAAWRASVLVSTPWKNARTSPRPSWPIRTAAGRGCLQRDRTIPCRRSGRIP